MLLCVRKLRICEHLIHCHVIQTMYYIMSLVLGKPDFCICKNKVQYFFLNPKFQVSCHHQWLYCPVCIGPGRKPQRLKLKWHNNAWSSALNCEHRLLYCISYKQTKNDLILISLYLLVSRSRTEIHTKFVILLKFEPRHEKTNNVDSEQV